MNIVLPIIFFAVAMGLYVKKITSLHWCAMALWIMIVVAYNYSKH